MNTKPTTKRLQVDKNNSMILVFVGVSAVVTVFALVVCNGLWNQSRYISRVVDKQDKALKQLKTNKIAVDTLASNYKVFDAKDPNYIGGDPGGLSSKDGKNSDLILDALPNKYDFPALASSIEGMLQGYSIRSITGSDDSLANKTPAAGSPIEMPFSFEVNNNYAGLKQLINNFHKSIRPFNITRLELSGSNNALKIVVNGKTYYQPDTSLKITEQEVK